MAIPLSCPSCGALLSNEPVAAPPMLRCTCGAALHRNEGIWTGDASFQPPSFPEARSRHLRGLVRFHFWYGPREDLFRRLLARWVHGTRDAVLDLGCGAGTMLPGLARLFRETAGVDGHLALLQEARQRSPSSLFVHGPTARLPFQDGQFDGVVCLDVLEHNEPRALLGEARRVLKHGGTLLLAVPACPWLWSQADEAAGHRCRYTLRSLRDELRAAGFSVVGHTHYQFILFPLVCFSRLFARHRTPVAERQPGRRLNSLLRAINQVEVTAFHRWALPWGSSLVVGARRAGMPAAA